MTTPRPGARSALMHALTDAGISMSLALGIGDAVEGLDAARPGSVAQTTADALSDLARAGLDGNDLRSLQMRGDVLEARELLDRGVDEQTLRDLARGGSLRRALGALDAGASMTDLLRVVDSAAIGLEGLADLTRAGMPAHVLDLILPEANLDSDVIIAIVTADGSWDTVTALLEARTSRAAEALREYAGLIIDARDDLARIPQDVRLLAALLATGSTLLAVGLLPTAATAVGTTWATTALGLLRDAGTGVRITAIGLRDAVVTARALEQDLPTDAATPPGEVPRSVVMLEEATRTRLEHPDAWGNSDPFTVYAAAGAGQPWLTRARTGPLPGVNSATHILLADEVLVARGILAPQREIAVAPAPAATGRSLSTR